jgi:hypothetical protein
LRIITLLVETGMKTGKISVLINCRCKVKVVPLTFSFRQNCDIHAVKALRKFYQRPYFLSSSVSPAHFNWVLMSSDYSTKIYKKVSILALIRMYEGNKVMLLNAGLFSSGGK